MKTISLWILLSLFLISCGKEVQDISCTVTETETNTTISCPNGTSSTFQKPYQVEEDLIGLTITEIVDPCGDSPGITDEVLLRLSNHKLLASFSDSSNGTNTRFSLIEPGQYETTDGSHCHFTVTSDYSIYY